MIYSQTEIGNRRSTPEEPHPYYQLPSIEAVSSAEATSVLPVLVFAVWGVYNVHGEQRNLYFSQHVSAYLALTHTRICNTLSVIASVSIVTIAHV